MAVISPVPKEKAPAELQETYEGLIKRLGRIINMYGAMAHRPNALKAFLALNTVVMREGTVEARYKELAYLKAALTNGCEY
jgi:alkylhydroperoxidase family enzyme